MLVCRNLLKYTGIHVGVHKFMLVYMNLCKYAWIYVGMYEFVCMHEVMLVTIKFKLIFINLCW